MTCSHCEMQIEPERYELDLTTCLSCAQSVHRVRAVIPTGEDSACEISIVSEKNLDANYRFQARAGFSKKALATQRHIERKARNE